VSDRGDIVELVARFADAVNRLDLEQFEQLWTPEATWVIDPPTGLDMTATRQEITAMFGEGMRGNWSSFSQYVHGTVVDIDGERATARSYLAEIGIPREGDGGYHNHGTYLDELERTAEGWRFRRRHYRYLYLEAAALTGVGAPLGGPQ
jgi:ketosteroid isomerase-like protein